MTNGSFPDITELAAKLSQNGELREMIGQLMQNNASADGDVRNTDESRTSGASLPFDMSALASMITPEMAQSLPSILSALGASGRPDENHDRDGGHGDDRHDGHDGKHDHESNGDRHGCGEKERRALLHALRPFLSENRRRALDMMIGIEQLGMIRSPKK